MIELYDTLLSLSIGLGLAAACGFRIFVPMLITSIAAKSGHLELAESFMWLASDAALISLGAATVVEVLAYYVPWLDNLLDGITTPCAVVAGTIVMAGFIPEMDAWLKWSLAIISGGTAAGAVQAATVFTRGLSTASTSILAVFLPFLAAVGLLGMLGLIGWRVTRSVAGREEQNLPRLLPAPSSI
jgi:hypothetical protein